MRRRAVRLALVAVARSRTPAHAVDPVASFRYLVTGNGFGFQVFDSSPNAIKQYLEHPYRYLHANPANPDGEGIVRRNLVFDTYFGVQGRGDRGVARRRRRPTDVGYVERVEHDPLARSTVGGVDTETFFVAPFGYPGNAHGDAAQGHEHRAARRCR